MWGSTIETTGTPQDGNSHDAGCRGTLGNWDRTTNKRHIVDNDGGYHVWSESRESAEAQMETDVHDAHESNDAKRLKSTHDKHLHWTERLATAEGQHTVLLAELSMAEYHLQQLQEIVRAATLLVEEKKAALNECRTHVARMSEAVGVLSALGLD